MVAGTESSDVPPDADSRIGSILPLSFSAGRISLSFSSLYELLVIFGLLFLAELLVPGVLAVGYFEPHPFWVPVLLLSVQYGTLTGLSAAIVATLARFFVGWPMPDGSEDYYTYFLRIWQDPVLWLATAIVLGSISDRLIGQRNSLAVDLQNSDEQRRSIGRLCDDLTRYTAHLECHIASSEERSAESVLLALGELSSCAPSTLEATLKRATETVLGSAVLSTAVFVAIEGGLVRARFDASRGVSPPGALAAEPIDQGFVEAVVAGRRTLVARRGQTDALLLTGIGVAASPIIDDVQGVCGVIVIEEAIGQITEPQVIGLTMIGRALSSHVRAVTDQVPAPSPVNGHSDRVVAINEARAAASAARITPLRPQDEAGRSIA